MRKSLRWQNVDFAAGVVLQFFLLAQGRVVGVVREAAAGGVVLVGLDLAGEVAGGGELQALCGWQRAHLVETFVGVVALALGDVDDGEGAEALDGHTATALGELVADLVEDGGQNLFYGGATDA